MKPVAQISATLSRSLELDETNAGGPLVLVEWEDSRIPAEGWVLRETVLEEDWDIVTCRSVGWLLHQDERVTLLAPTHGDGMFQVLGVLRIPTRSIVAQARLGRVVYEFPTPLDSEPESS